MYTINPGDFKHPIEIQKIDYNTENTDNTPPNSYITSLKVKAKIVNISGKEVAMAQGDNLVQLKRFIIRYPKNIEITNEDRLIYNSKIYNIKYPSDVQEEHKYLEIVAELVS